MYIKEILDRITVEDIERAMGSFDENHYERIGVKDEFTLVYNEKEFPVRELIMRASGDKLKRANNSSSYTSNLAKKKLKDLGYKKFKDQEKMYKYYIKKASNQDVEKTTVINNEAEHSFFGINIPNKEDSAIITIKYLPDNEIVEEIKITRKQDIRIYIDRKRFKEKDILIFEKIENDIFSLTVKTNYDIDYPSLNISLKNNFLLTDVLPSVDKEFNVVNDQKNEYSKKQMKQPLNQILFGPPGTGKTDSTVEKALEILELKTGDRENDREIFRSLLNKKIFFVTMHPSYSYEDFVQGIKPRTSDDGELLFEAKPGIFKQVSKIAYEEYNSIKIAQDPSVNIDFEMVFNYAFNQLLEDNEPIEIARNGNNFKIIKITDRTLKFETSTGNTGPTYNLSKSTIKKIFNKGINDIILSGNKGYFDSLQEFLNQKSEELKSSLIKEFKNNTNSSNNNYVLILDEINRANISKVFGELITLLEEDKRIGKENEMSVTLPSGEIFAVPSNLYVIGTMNTADKSIALVDIALRRRFQFIPVYPDPTVIDLHCKSTDKVEKKAFMTSLNALLRKEKGVDFQIGHAYFLKDNSLSDVINENVIPLLTEYFRNDLEKVRKHMKDIGFPLHEDYFNETGLLKYIK